ncbi:hypothetical protein QJU11_10100 [Pasteurella atlantica]|uniref:hypothetical protein n=1 Tax=Phocoenobacter atlanticus TaxID=3416742 RepID=UPI002767ACF7|nr:hypothetical protein [Pasteurella atlantica]MDP8042543.1 hypothetical protein [Pasteurella atlantica]
MKKTNFENACENFKKSKDELLKNESFENVVKHSMNALYKLEAQILEDGGVVNFHIPSCKWNIEQAIINRDSSHNMRSSAFEYVENLQERMMKGSGLG